MGRAIARSCALVVAVVGIARAAAGDLDPSFGSGGIARTDLGDDRLETTTAVLMQPDGKVVLVGYSYHYEDTSVGITVVRYAADGTLDPTFGTGGVVDHLPANAPLPDVATLQPDGKIVVAGSGTDGRIVVVRYRSDGAPDPAFGTGGVSESALFSAGTAHAVAIAPDGKIVVAGGAQSFSQAMIVRFTASGAVDQTFGALGTVADHLRTFPPGTLGAQSVANDVVVQPDGKIVIVGGSGTRSDFQMALARFTVGGAFDSTFGVGGRVLTQLPGSTGGVGLRLRLQPDGKLLAAGSLNEPAHAVVRYLSGGTVDATFGTSGYVTAPVPGGFLRVETTTLQEDAKLVIAGEVVPEDQIELFAYRFDVTGAPDATFAGGGFALADAIDDPMFVESAVAVATQPDGSVVVAGDYSDNGHPFPTQGFVVARFLGDCGNGTVSGIEQCDAGAANGAPGSCCTTTCTFLPTGSICRPAADVCDRADACTGSSSDCPADEKADAGTTCRPAADVCDAAEACDGATDACPPDGLVTAGVECRAAAGPCDVAEVCTGDGVSCPADAFAPSTTVCRSSAGVCDVAETCSGASATCPDDVKAPPATECRGAAGPCDAAEHCNGAGDDCPADTFASNGTVCRASTAPCDLAEECTGADVTCPADTGLPDTAADGICDGDDRCPSVADPTQLDTDGDGLGDACDPCTNGASASRPKLNLTRIAPPAGDDKLAIGGEAIVPTAPPLDPSTRGVRVLLVAASGEARLDVTIPGGAYDPLTKTGWRTNGAGTAWTFKAPGPATMGIQKITIRLVPSVAGKLKLRVKGKNGAYAVVPADLPIVATLVLDAPAASGGQCVNVAFPATAPARPSCTLTPTALRCR